MLADADGFFAFVEVLLLILVYLFYKGQLQWLKKRFLRWELSKYALVCLVLFSMVGGLWFLRLLAQHEDGQVFTCIVFVGTLAGLISCGRLALIARIDYDSWEKSHRRI